MAPEIIVRDQNQGQFLSTNDLSKVDTFALGIILVNMMTGSYLFESCLTQEYERLITDATYMADTLKAKQAPEMDENELADLINLL